jgi:hypothetical protein
MIWASDPCRAARLVSWRLGSPPPIAPAGLLSGCCSITPRIPDCQQRRTHHGNVVHKRREAICVVRANFAYAAVAIATTCIAKAGVLTTLRCITVTIHAHNLRLDTAALCVPAPTVATSLPHTGRDIAQTGRETLHEHTGAEIQQAPSRPL